MKIKKMVVISISIILIGLILQILPSNFTSLSTLRGKYFPATIEVTPEIAVYNEILNIKITSPYYFYRGGEQQYWIGDKIYFYNNDLRKGEKKICSSSKCRGNFIIEYTTPTMMYTGSNWPEGIYTVKIYDYLNKKYVEDIFQLVNLSNPLIVCKDTDRGEDKYHKGETYSFKTGKRIKKEDVCVNYELYYYNPTHLVEYYCCEKTDPNYKIDLGMCSKTIVCDKKCKDGACYDYYS